jgi:hypothetical protein
MADVMEAADAAEVTNTETAMVSHAVEAAMKAVPAMMTAVSAAMTAVAAAMTAASRCDGGRESCRNDRGRDGKSDGHFPKH